MNVGNSDIATSSTFIGGIILAFPARPQCGTVLEYHGNLIFGPKDDRYKAVIQEGDTFQIEQLHRLSPEVLEKLHLAPRHNLCWGRFAVVDAIDCLEINKIAVPISELASARIIFIGSSAFKF
jgi:hypothetical protein